MPTVPLPIQIEDEKDWNALAKAQGVQGVSIYQLTKYESASKIGDAQYLALRALWKRNKKGLLKPCDWGLQGVETARQKLSELTHWKPFIEAVPLHVPVDEILPITHDLGEFKLIWYYGQLIRGAPSAPDNEDNLAFTPISKRTRSRTWQPDYQALLETPTRPCKTNLQCSLTEMSLENAQAQGLEITPSTIFSPATPEDDVDQDPDYDGSARDVFPPVSDENVVNTYLVGFASLLTLSAPGISAHWSQERKGYKVSDKQGTKLYEARTDGHLFLSNGKESKAIVEVKAMVREDSSRVMMQETAEMAAWIHAEPDEISISTPKNTRSVAHVFHLA